MRRFDTNMLLLKCQEEDTLNMAGDILQNLPLEKRNDSQQDEIS